MGLQDLYGGILENMEIEDDWGWTKHAVEMIPFGLLAGFYGEKEIRITKLAEEGFCVRISAASKITKLQENFKLCFFEMKKNRYREITVTPELWKVETRTEFFISYAVAVCQEDYQTAVRSLILEYDCYIRLKLEGDDSALAKQLTGYPANEDDVFAESFQKQMDAWPAAEQKEAFQEPGRQNETGKNMRRQPEIQQPEFALTLDHPSAYEHFLNQDSETFLEDYRKCYPVFENWMSKRSVKRLYIGNAFCHLLFPKETQLFAMLKKTKENGLMVTLSFSYVREYQLPKLEQLLNMLQKWCEEEKTQLEIEVNDWGLAEMLRCGHPNLLPCYGRLLNKRKKDPRMRYKKGCTELLRENSLNAAFYRAVLKQEFGIHRFEWESCGYEQSLPENNSKLLLENHLHLPFYQTNTSQYCTLYAGSEYGNRGRQRLLTACDQRCEWQVYLYPRHLYMVGRYNSLFGMDVKILKQAGIAPYDPVIFEKFCLENPIDRFVFPSIL